MLGICLGVSPLEKNLDWIGLQASFKACSCYALHADLAGRRALSSAGSSRLVVPPVKLSTVSSRAFPVAAAQLCNSLPDLVWGTA